MGDLVVRPALLSDAARLVKLRRTLFSETHFMLLKPSEFKSTAKDEAHRIRFFDAKPNALLLVAEEGQELLGTLIVLGDELQRLHHSAALALGVKQAHWGRGIASRMIGNAIAWSRGRGIRRLELTVPTNNLRAVRVCLRAGFQIEGLRRASFAIEGRYVDEYLMSAIADD
jgi:RimJ/RimL family protein N-acetyltransferase